MWIGVKEHRGLVFVALGAMALTAYGIVAAFQRSNEFGRVLAAYGGVFIVGSMLWGSRSTRFDVPVLWTRTTF